MTIQRCMMVPLDKAPKVDISSGVVPEGMYRVGVDIPAGEYKLRNNAEYDGYYEVRSSSLASEGFDSIITNENFSGDVYVTVQDQRRALSFPNKGPVRINLKSKNA